MVTHLLMLPIEVWLRRRRKLCDAGGEAMKLRAGVVAVLTALTGVVGIAAPVQAEDLAVAISSPINGSTGPTDITVSGTSNADESAYRLVLVVNDEDRYATLQEDGSWQLENQQFNEGWNTLCAQVRSLDLIVTYASYCSAYRVLPGDLEFLITAPTERAVVAPTVTIEGYVNYESTIRVFVDGSGPTLLEGVTGSFVYDGGFIVDGPYTVTMLARDIYGRTATATVSFTVDATPPLTPNVTSPSPKKVIRTKEFTVSGTGEPLTYIEIRSQSGELTGRSSVMADGTWSYTFTENELGPYYTDVRTPFTFQVAAFDQFGNLSPTRSYSFPLRIAP
jgi:large repetitive protein